MLRNGESTRHHAGAGRPSINADWKEATGKIVSGTYWHYRLQ
jgi:hypothetical protein